MRKLKKFLINLIPNKELRHKKRNELKLKYHMKNVHGTNNTIEGDIPRNVDIRIWGNNNRIVLGKTKNILNMSISIGSKIEYVNNCFISIGENSSAGGISISLMDDNSEVKIGSDCMFSWGILIYCTDFHSILDSNKKLTNLATSIEIGNHVWIGRDARILKNTKISDNSIVGCGSIVTKKFDKSGVVIAGNPAKIVKENINWDRRTPNRYLSDQNSGI